jgi:hypothetical protein
MTGLVEVLGGVAARRAVAAADVTTRQTEPEMNPGRTQPQTLFTAKRVGGNWLKADEMRTLHFGPPYSACLWAAAIMADEAVNLTTSNMIASRLVGKVRLAI